VRDNGGRAPDIENEALAADLALARDLLNNPPRSVGFSADGPVAVAASAVELHLTSRASVSDDDLAWSATVLLQVAASIAELRNGDFDDSLFSQGADRSAARALPFLLLPAARELRAVLSAPGTDDVDELIALSRAVAVNGVNETRLAYARALDAVWAAPCDTAHLFGRCHHRIAFDLVTESFVDSLIGSWDSEAQRCSIVSLDPPNANARHREGRRHLRSTAHGRFASDGGGGDQFGVLHGRRTAGTPLASRCASAGDAGVRAQL